VNALVRAALPVVVGPLREAPPSVSM
jgi:hypothetical protein